MAAHGMASAFFNAIAAAVTLARLIAIPQHVLLTRLARQALAPASIFDDAARMPWGSTS